MPFVEYEPQLLTVTLCGSHKNGPCRPPVTGGVIVQGRKALALKAILCSPRATSCSPPMAVGTAGILRQSSPWEACDVSGGGHWLKDFPMALLELLDCRAAHGHLSLSPYLRVTLAFQPAGCPGLWWLPLCFTSQNHVS